MLKVDANTRVTLNRIKDALRKTQPGSTTITGALQRIGNLIVAAAKINARAKGVFDSGNLINKIRWEYDSTPDKDGILVGVFGVKYAAMNEFGGPFTDRQRRAMFAALRFKGGPGAQPKKAPVIQGNHWRARPYLGPAFRSNKNRILEIMRSAIVE